MEKGVGLLARVTRARGALLASTAALAIVAGGPPALAEQQEFTISPQPVEAALKEFARQADVELLVVADDVDELDSSGAASAATREEAVSDILRGTGLIYRFEQDDNLLVVTPAADTASTDGRIRVNAVFPDNGDQMAQVSEAPRRQERAGDEGRVQVASAEFDEGGEEADMEEMIVTGSNIRGAAPVGSQLFVIDRTDIDRTGFATTQQVIQSLPQNFGGGPNEDNIRGADALSNLSFGSGINLRGLGAGSTLVLVNGRRQSAAGDQGSFVDVSSIPTTAIERIEVLTDGASAIYGSDAIGGVVNIVLIDDYDGAETRARFGTVTQGNLQEYQVGQVFGKSWDSGRVLFSYEYYKREALAATDRDFSADGDQTRFGGDNFNIFADNPGNILDPLTGLPAFAIPEGQDGTSLTPGDLIDLSVFPDAVNLQNLNEFRDLLPEQERHSFFLSFSQKVGDRIELFGDARYSKRDFERRREARPLVLNVPSSHPFFVDPFGGSASIRVAYSFIDDLGPRISQGDVQAYSAALGATIDAGNGWQVSAYGAYSKERTDQEIINSLNRGAVFDALADPDPTTTFNPFGDGSNTNPATIEAIRSVQTGPPRNDVWSANVTADGPLFSLPAGEVKLAIGGDYRRETLDFPVVEGLEQLAFNREIFAAFGELFVPLFGDANARPALRRLEFSVAGRFEDYNDFGSTANPKIGALWSPVEGLAMRGTFGTSFKAPNLRDLEDSNNSIIIDFVTDPLSPAGTAIALVRSGNNRNLVEETATIWTTGVEYTPPVLPSLRLALNYFNIRFKNRITRPDTPSSTILSEEERFGAVIQRDPSQDEIDALCSSDEFFLPDPSVCSFLPISVIIDFRVNNTAITKVRGLDFTASYSFDSNIGSFDVGLNGSYLLEFEEAFSSEAPIVSIVDTVNNPIDFRMRANVSWRYRGFGASAFVNYSDSYTDNVSDPERGIDAWTTLDLQLSYRTEDQFTESWLNGITVSLSVLNVFDEDPPFVNELSGYDATNADPLGRFIAVQLTKEW